MASIEIDGVNGVIKSTVSDADLTIKGNDGGSEISALTFDMSDAGTASFNHDIKLVDGAIIDCAGDVTFDVDGGDLKIQDGGTSVVNFGLETGNFIMNAVTSDTDMIFKGNDGGSAITALTLDMSAAGNATFNGAIIANAGVSVDNITIDGTEIDLSSGDLTLDVAGDIILDADGGDIILKDDGTHWASLYTNGTHTYLQNMISDGDIYFTVNDGGSNVNALIIDGSVAGSAYFNANVAVGGSSNTRALVSGNADVDGNIFAIVSGLRGLDDRDPKPSNFPIGIVGNFANYAGDGGGSPYADVLVFDTFGHSSAGNATALFISKADPNDIKLAQQTTRSTTTFTGGTQVNIDTSSISDASVKENVQNITGALDKIAQLRPVTFEWTDEYINNGLSKNAEEKVFTEGTLATFYEEGDTLPEGKKVGDVKTEGVTPTRIIPDTKVTNVGLIAQEVELVIPTVVHQNRVSLAGSTDYQKNIDYDKLVPHLIGAIKELKAKVEALEDA
jgi:hypothetical protein